MTNVVKNGDLQFNTGRTASYVIAASNATTLEKAQTDYVCTGTSSLSASIANGSTGIVSVPGAWTSNTSKTVSTAGDFTVTLASGQYGIVTKGTAKLELVVTGATSGQKTLSVTDSSGLFVGDQVTIGDDSTSETNYITKISDLTITMLNSLANTYSTNPYITPRLFNLVAGVNTILVKTTGTIYISGMGDEAVIQSAINTLSAGNGGGVKLSSGTFNLCNTIKLFPSANTVSLIGSGMYATQLIMSSWSNCNGIEIKYTTGVSSGVIPLISGFRLGMNGYTGALSHSSISSDGTYPVFNIITPANAVQTAGDGIVYMSTSSTAGATGHDVIFENVIIGTAYRDGWRLANSWGIHLNNCYSENCVRDGVYFWGSASYFNQVFSSYNGHYQFYFGDAAPALSSATSNNSFNALKGYTNSSNSTFLGLGMLIQYSTAGQNSFNDVDLYGYIYYNSGTNTFITTYGNYDTWNNVLITGFSSARTDKGINIAGKYNSFNNLMVSNTNTSAIAFASGSEQNVINGGWINKPVTDVSGKVTNIVRNVTGYIAPGEIRTYSGSIATLTQDAFNSLDNPFGQAVRVLSLDIYVSTTATATSPNIDCGIGSSPTTDYTTLFDDLPGETIGFYKSTLATPGTQTVPQLWATGSGNRYLNMSIKDAAATGMVATYTVTVMGN